ncbi:VTT domain-containing protein [Lacticaseibacillus camelliae]|uniref:DedA protein (DSG-1 protein) n=1 Tax=Lacticaseibacillus camelliae DSM 22697 = JCM 13995 TaxID=1423730 RepID=A0A0R2EYA1_9LACO|nr:VTT domain-containing protein [Lacticaseibacillus camelliae]KRN21321.1 DedA protein (DSG-1 protein) [Lacticaseibacillus camelliae DSM 22697 = JCM 13995]
MSVLLLSLIPNLSQLLPQWISQFGNLIYIGLFGLIFIETGVVILPFLPGDSLLFLCGSLAALNNQGLNIWLLIGLLSIAAIAGDALNFEIGEHFGNYLMQSQKLSRLIKPNYIKRSQRFFKKHGKPAIFLGRFVPIIRTFIPFTAGISKMRYRDFALYNVLGGLSWVLVALGSGYFFGNIAVVKAHFELIMLAIIAISLLPAAIMGLCNRRGEPIE